MEFSPRSPLIRKAGKCGKMGSPRVAKMKKSIAMLKTLKAGDSPTRGPLGSPSRMNFHDFAGSPKKKSAEQGPKVHLEPTSKENDGNTSVFPTTPKKNAKGAHLKRKASEIMGTPNDKMGKRLSSCGRNVRRNSQQFAANAWSYGRQNINKALAMRQKSALTMDPEALKMFGKPIEDLMMIQQHIPPISHLLIPALIHDTVAILLKHSLTVEGIFRISGSLKMMEGVVAKLNAGELPDMQTVVQMEAGVNVVSGLLKKFLREMPEPILTFKLFHDFVSVVEEKEDEMQDSDEEKLNKVRDLLDKLPPTNFFVIKQLVYLFTKIAENEDKTRMTADNIAIVMGPNLLKNPVEDPLLVFHEVEMVKNVVKCLILNSQALFEYDDMCIANYHMVAGGDLDFRASYRSEDDSEIGVDSESDLSEKIRPEERPSKKRKIRKGKLFNSAFSASKKELFDLAARTPLPRSPPRSTSSTYSLASQTPLPPSPVRPELVTRAEQTPLPPSPVSTSVVSLAAATPLPVSPLRPGVRALADQTPLPTSPISPALISLAADTPLPASPLRPGVRALAEQTPLPTSPISPTLVSRAVDTPLPASPLKPGVRALADQTPLPTSPISPSLVSRAVATPLPFSPLRPGVRELAEHTPLPPSPLKAGQLKLAEQTPLPVSPLRPGVRTLAEQTPLPTSPISPSLVSRAVATPLPFSPLGPGVRELAEHTPLPPSPLKAGQLELAEQTPLPPSPLKLALAEQTPLPTSKLPSIVRRSLLSPRQDKPFKK